MINNKFKGYTYTEYQNEMCDKAIESNENALELYTMECLGIARLHARYHRDCRLDIEAAQR